LSSEQLPSAAQLEEEALDLLKSANRRGVVLRLYGSLAFRARCGAKRERFDRKRPSAIRDIDFVSLLRWKGTIEAMFRERGWRLDRDLATAPSARASILYYLKERRIVVRCDVAYNALEYSHSIDIENRLGVDDFTLPLAELLLSKLQSARLAEKDCFDVAMLFLTHPLAENDGDGISARRIVELFQRDSGLAGAARAAATRVAEYAQGSQFLRPWERDEVREKADVIVRLTPTRPQGMFSVLVAPFSSLGHEGREINDFGLQVGDLPPEDQLL
jgi:hypothetical protein